MKYFMEKIKFPFEGSKWVIYPEDKMSEPFGQYDTKKEAKADAKEFGIRVEEV